jgi:hypothetical protein
MRVGLADKDEVAVCRQDRLAGGLAGIQIVAEKDRVEAFVFAAMCGQPALGRARLAVLLLGAVLRLDEFRL